MKQLILFFTSIGILFSCKNKHENFDATGVFETAETVVSAEANGKIMDFNVQEGDKLTANQIIGSIDPSNLELQKLQLEASLVALNLKQQDAQPQVNIISEQMKAQKAQINTLKEQERLLEREKNRVSELVKAEAVPTKQYDDIAGQLDVLKKQITAADAQYAVLNQQINSQKQQISIVNKGILSETQPLKERIKLIDDQINKSKIINPTIGTVMVKYAETHEMTGVGKPLYKLGDTENMVLRAYLNGNQLSKIKLNQTVKVYTDNDSDSYNEHTGKIIWISEKAEFTPKTIQTKDERSNLVYAIKVAVKNTGTLKSGMYGELKFAQ